MAGALLREAGGPFQVLGIGDFSTKIESLIGLKDVIRELSHGICGKLREKFEPEEEIASLNYYLDAYFEDVWTMINLP